MIKRWDIRLFCTTVDEKEEEEDEEEGDEEDEWKKRSGNEGNFIAALEIVIPGEEIRRDNRFT